MFLVLKRLRYEINGENSIMLKTEQSIIQRFNEYLELFVSYKLKEGSVIPIDGRLMSNCYIKVGNNKKLMHLIKDQLMLILAEPILNDKNNCKIVFIDQLKFIELAVDRSNPRALVIASKNKVFFW